MNGAAELPLKMIRDPSTSRMRTSGISQYFLRAKAKAITSRKRPRFLWCSILEKSFSGGSSMARLELAEIALSLIGRGRVLPVGGSRGIEALSDGSMAKEFERERSGKEDEVVEDPEEQDGDRSFD